MNSKVVYAVLLALTLLIVLPVLSTVNATSAHQARGQTVLFAAGSPGPPPTPHLNEQAMLVAAGSPGHRLCQVRGHNRNRCWSRQVHLVRHRRRTRSHSLHSVDATC